MDTGQIRDEVTKLNPLNPRQREMVEGDIENLELALHGQPMRYTGGDARASGYIPEGHPGEEKGFMGRPPVALPDPDMVRQALVADRMTLKAGTPPEYSGHRKNLLHKIYNEEVKTYQDGLLSEGQLWENTQANLTQHMRHSEENDRRGKLIANIHAILDPHDDMFNLNSLRPVQAIRFNPAMFRKGYEGVRWTPEEDVERIVDELDDETYKTFLTLKLATAESGVIMQKMTIDRAVYDACEARLAEQHQALDLEQPQGHGLTGEASLERMETLIRFVGESPQKNFREILKGVKGSSAALKALIDEALVRNYIEKHPDGGYILSPLEDETAN